MNKMYYIFTLLRTLKYIYFCEIYVSITFETKKTNRLFFEWFEFFSNWTQRERLCFHQVWLVLKNDENASWQMKDQISVKGKRTAFIHISARWKHVSVEQQFPKVQVPVTGRKRSVLNVLSPQVNAPRDCGTNAESFHVAKCHLCSLLIPAPLNVIMNLVYLV